MSEGLRDPDLPPGAIVQTFVDDGVLRNDGVKLTPASKNPWYVLATVAGEQEDVPFIDDELHARNRRFWNGWMCRGMCDAERLELAKHMGLSEAELSPLSEVEVQQLSERFQLAFQSTPPVEVVPKADELIKLSSTYFPKAFSLERCFFAESAFFDAAHFVGAVDLSASRFVKSVYVTNAYFSESAFFKQVHLSRGANFLEVHFGGKADFNSAYFGKEAFFPKARFKRDADFDAARMLEGATFFGAHFAGSVSFQNSHFGESVDFSNGRFNGTTDFGGARFKGGVPKFFHRKIHQDTSFSDDPALWPEVTPQNAEEGKRAYTRLRQVAAEIYDPDLEHFFLRQEMRCKARIELDKGAWFHWLLFRLYRCLADSGISVARPFWLLVFFWAFGFACFAGHFDSGVLADLPPDIQDSRYGAAAGVSFGNLFGFLGINRLYFTDLLRDHSPGGLQFVAGLQTVSGVVLLFFLGLGLRNRFRLK
ncbi:MAG: pentapeptide repeat-containing protein [Pseudomonadota bacterium]|uniref:pentapeptide repeat-containing protein n=1 Tax=Roseovarius TaxID=74030 RepID=UPI0022A75E1B|nr:pentapeptide repeat-containing protein [Roseovarius sp. EGI FJ00037]MCZ0810679.1 pentapeptide repeat-containing protein [Roseovarius sp. EGI FJ00037]